MSKSPDHRPSSRAPSCSTVAPGWSTLFTLALVLGRSSLCASGSSRNGSSGAYIWFNKLPNENLDGVPKVLVDNEKNFASLKSMTISIVGRTGYSRAIVNQARRQQKAQKIINDSISFPCDVRNGRSKEKPTSVHAIRPGDIDVVAAMGDSIMAGSGALAVTLQQVFVENRGICGMIGGQGNWRTFLTLPNILKEFNPNLIGYSLGDSITFQRESQFNIAEPGAMSQDLLFMAQKLVKRIKSDRRVHFNEDWKLVTLLIGVNNYCSDICYLKDANTSVQTHKNDLISSLRYIRDNMPRTIINLIQTPTMRFLFAYKSQSPSCDLIHRLYCSCLFSAHFSSKRNYFFHVMDEWQRVEEEVANDEMFRTKEDFTITLQQFPKHFTYPSIRDPVTGEEMMDPTYVAPDCFHFTQKAYARAANALWNNMLEPAGSKSTNWITEFQKIACPTERFPYIFTWKNSKL